MVIAYTISTHNGSQVARGHNIRNRIITDKESHIDPNGVYEIWVDEPERQAYDRLFGEAVKKYNEQQKRPERRIKSYYANICNDEKKHTAYEMIISVGNKDNPINQDVGKDILRSFVDDWKNRNPNLEMIGAYYHADEPGVPHVHIDYIPVAHGYKRGLETQTGLVKALGEMGLVKQGKLTAQIQWQQRENSYLESLCKEYDLEIEHPDAGKGKKHLETVAYQIKQDAEKEAAQLLQKAVEKVSEIEKQAQTDIKAAVDETVKNITAVSNSIEKKQGFRPEILSEKPEKKRVFGGVEQASVTISRKDYDIMVNIIDDREVQKQHINAVGQLSEIGENMAKNSFELHRSRLVAEEISVDERVKSADERAATAEKEATYAKELCASAIDSRAKIRDTLANERSEHRKEIKNITKEAAANLKKIEEEAEEKLNEANNQIDEYESIIKFIPDTWADIKARTSLIRKMESLYRTYKNIKWGESKPGLSYEPGFSRSSIDLHPGSYYFYINGKRYSEKKFLLAYIEECNKQNISPDKDMIQVAIKKKVLDYNKGAR